MSLLQNSNAIPTAGDTDFYEHQIANSLRGHSNSRLYQSINSTASSGTKVAISFWHKMANAGTATGTTGLFTAFANETNIVDLNIQTWGTHSIVQSFQFSCQDGSGSYGCKWADAGEQNDPSTFKHIVLILDSTQGTSTNRAKLYINGDQKTTSNTLAAIPSNHIWHYTKNGSTMNMIQRYSSGYGNVFDGYLAEVVLIDGAASISDFGETKNGVWIPKDPSGLTFGNNGYYCKFENSGDLGNDSSGNNNDFSVSNLSAHDQMLDSPTFNSSSNGGNFCTLNSITDAVNMTLSEGNLTWTTSSNNRSINCNFKLHAGTGQKWYWEHRMSSWAGSESDDVYIGINVIQPDWDSGSTRGGGNTGNSYGAQGYKNVLGTDTSSYGAQIDTGDVWGIAVDMENYTIQFYKEGSAQGAAWSISSTTEWYPWVGSGGGGSTASGTFNFGQNGTFNGTETAGGNTDTNGYGNFFSSVPEGFKALCSANLPVGAEIDPAQTDDNYPQKLFSPVLYTGNGSSQSVTGVGFQPDWTWLKNRNDSQGHKLFDSTRGVTKVLSSHNTDAQSTESGLSAFGSDGFSFSGSTVAGYNTSSNTYVAWNWRANGGTTSTNSNGSTNSTVQVDPSGHFSIVKFEGQNDSWGNAETIGHGLSSAPTCMILKNYDKADEWSVFFSDYGNASIGGSNAASNSLVLNSNAALYTNQSYKGWGGVMPTSTVFTVDGNNNNGSGESIIVYCFANCEGYIKAGSYIANSNADNAFVYTGFRPAFLLVKGVVSGSHWQIIDNKRDGYNPTPESLDPGEADASYTGAAPFADLLSNGFKVRTNNAVMGSSSYDPYVYLAFAENPFKYATAR